MRIRCYDRSAKASSWAGLFPFSVGLASGTGSTRTRVVPVPLVQPACLPSPLFSPACLRKGDRHRSSTPGASPRFEGETTMKQPCRPSGNPDCFTSFFMRGQVHKDWVHPRTRSLCCWTPLVSRARDGRSVGRASEVRAIPPDEQGDKMHTGGVSSN